MAQITLENVTKSWGTTQVLQPLDLEIKNGEFVAVLGPSGCGKSTTLFLLAGLYAPTSGHIRFDGHDVNRVDARDRNVGIVFQSYALYPHLSVRDNIAFPLRFQKVEKADISRRVEEAASLVQIEKLLDRKPSQLSGGQQQRVALARALVKEPNSLLLDEPLSNLDATLRISMRAELKNIQKRLGITTLIVTHDQIEAITMADRIICMNAGRVEQIGTPDDLYRRPANLFVAGFIGSPPMNILHGDATAKKLMIGSMQLSLTSNVSGKVALGIRPEDITLSHDTNSSELHGEVTLIEPLGREVFYTLKTPLGTLHALEAGEIPQHKSGDRLALHFQSTRSLIFDENGARIEGLNAILPTSKRQHAISA